MQGFRSKRSLTFGSVFVLFLLVFASAAQAQEMPPLPGEVVVGGVSAPRGIAFDDEGNLIVAVAGSGGDIEQVMMNPEGETAMSLGMSGEILRVGEDGTVTPWIQGFPSYAGAMETTGLYRAIPQGDSLWVLFTGCGPCTIGHFWQDSIVELDAETLAVNRIINLNAFETAEDPDGNGYDSNVADIAWTADGTMLIVDAGMNALLSWTEADGLATVQAWPDNPVPTSVEIAENGDVYVGFLGAGLAPGAGKIEHWSNGELVHTYEGLNTITDILLDGDTLYAVEMVLFTEQGPGPGRVITVDENGVTPVAEGLITPFALAQDADGALYVSFGTLAFGPDTPSGVIKLDMEAM